VSGDIGGESFDRLLAGTRQALESVRGSGGDDDDEAAEVRGEGEAADGLVRATVVPGGRLESVQVKPRLVRSGIDAVCEQIVVAVNAALDDLRAKAAEQRPPGAPDPAKLASQLRELQDESTRRMEVYGQALTDVLAQIRGRR
jgi:DNA-binding protein YbaB